MEYNHEKFVKSIKIKASFKDPEAINRCVEKEVILHVGDDHFIKCPMRECIEGGFDLRSQLAEPGLKIGRSGVAVCQGWQDKERINKHRCLNELHWKVVE